MAKALDAEEKSCTHKALTTFNVSDVEFSNIVNVQNSECILDSGCMSHICNDASKFGDSLTIASMELNFATYVSTKIKGKGIVRLSAWRKHTRDRFELRDTLFILNLGKNLMSIAQLANHGYDVIFFFRET